MDSFISNKELLQEASTTVLLLLEHYYFRLITTSFLSNSNCKYEMGQTTENCHLFINHFRHIFF